MVGLLWCDPTSQTLSHNHYISINPKPIYSGTWVNFIYVLGRPPSSILREQFACFIMTNGNIHQYHSRFKHGVHFGNICLV